MDAEWCPVCRGLFLDKGERQRLVGSSPAMQPSALPGGASSEGGGSVIEGAFAVAEVLAELAEILTVL